MSLDPLEMRLQRFRQELLDAERRERERENATPVTAKECEEHLLRIERTIEEIMKREFGKDTPDEMAPWFAYKVENEPGDPAATRWAESPARRSYSVDGKVVFDFDIRKKCQHSLRMHSYEVTLDAKSFPGSPYRNRAVDSMTLKQDGVVGTAFWADSISRLLGATLLRFLKK
jgi:hypothetical protein